MKQLLSHGLNALSAFSICSPYLSPQEFITPIVKVTKGKNSTSFYTLPEYENWKEANEEGKGYHIKYYKGTFFGVCLLVRNCVVPGCRVVGVVVRGGNVVRYRKEVHKRKRRDG